MAIADLINKKEMISTGKEGLVVQNIAHTRRGGATLDVTGFSPDVITEGHIVIQETSTGSLKPMPATELRAGAVATFGTLVAGSSYTNGTYENVPLTGGTGKGALATVVVSGAVVSTVTKTQGGEGYTVGDVLGIPGAFAGGTGSGGTVPIATTETIAAAYGSLPGGHTYYGATIGDIATSKPFAAIATGCKYVTGAAPYPVTSILSALKTALTSFYFE